MNGLGNTKFYTASQKPKKLNFNFRFNKEKLGKRGGIVLGVICALAIVLFFVFVRPAFVIFDVAKDLKKDALDLKLSLVERDLVLFNETLDRTEKDLGRALEARTKGFKWLSGLPIIKTYYTDFEYFINAGKHGINAGREFAVLVEPFAEATGFTTESNLNVPEGHSGLAEAFAGWISVMPEVAADMDNIIHEVSALGEELQKVDASKYPRNLFGNPVRSLIISLQNSLSQADEFGPDIKTAMEIMPSLLGVGTTEKRYAIIMQNDKEIRATGGFWTNYATFKLNNALLSSDFSSKDMYSIDHTLDIIDAYHTFPKVPPMYEKYLKVERMYARDANISPDFPTAIEQWMYFYRLALQVNPFEIKPIDGVIAIDTQVVKELLAVTGPVAVNGVTFSEENVVLELEKIASLSLVEQANRKKVLGDLMEGMLRNVFESDNNLWPKLVDKGFELMRRKHIVINLFDEQSQALVEKYNLAGRIVDPVEGDYFYANQTNLGGDKTNLFVTKEVTHKLEKSNGRWMRTVDIYYTYTPKGGEYGALEKRYQEWTRLYVPAGSEFISSEGSFEPNVGGEERGKMYFDGFIYLAPGEKAKMTFKYYLPDSAVGTDYYNLYIQKQSGIDREIHNVVINGKTHTFEIDSDKKVWLEL